MRMTRADVITRADINMVSCGVLDDFAYCGRTGSMMATTELFLWWVAVKMKGVN
jgi:hypothetical protein